MTNASDQDGNSSGTATRSEGFLGEWNTNSALRAEVKEVRFKHGRSLVRTLLNAMIAQFVRQIEDQKESGLDQLKMKGDDTPLSLVPRVEAELRACCPLLSAFAFAQKIRNMLANDKELVEFMDDALKKETKVYLATAEAMLTMQVDADSKVKQRVLADERLLRRLQNLPVFVQGANRRPIGTRQAIYTCSR